MEDRLLLISSQNISKLLTLLITHENNIKNRIRQNTNIDIEFIIGRSAREQNNDLNNDLPDLVDVSNNLQDMNDISNNINIRTTNNLDNIQYTTFNQIEQPNDIMCSITHDFFHIDDEVALLECGHYFKKTPFLVWSMGHNTCPICRANFRD